MKALHIVQGGIDNGDKSWLERASKKNLDAPIWVVPKSAIPGDDIVIYITGHGFFATAIIKSLPKLRPDWHNRYGAGLTSIRLIEPVISLDAIRKHIPELTWANYPRSITTPDSDIADKVRKLISEHHETEVPDLDDNTYLERNKKFTSDDYVSAFRSINILPHHLKMLQANYYAPDHTLTATQMSKAMGYKNFNASNLHYGKLGRLVGKIIGWVPKTTLHVLVEFEKPGREWLWIMRPEVIQAIERLGWNEDNQTSLPDEVTETTLHYEGAVHSISVNAYARSAAAREKCILHYGCKCSVCDMILADVYGEIAQGHIHIHHLRQLSEKNTEYQVDPIQDLRPISPNCHAIIHLNNPPKTIEEVKSLIEEIRKATKC
ncbi:MAG: hypothetical protein NUV74_06030 [Candidatus Brocadiaceae bacterium]|nr:hypothetical protein [Candidatus Brocadiaceae bacterium]